MKAVLDACVLYPTVLREVLIRAAEAGLYRPIWSERILGEWRHAAARLGQDGIAGAEIALLRDAWPDAVAADDGTAAAGIDWPDPADRHVAEAAVASGADLIVTANLRDFPPRATAALGLRAVHPDEFLTRLYNDAPDVIADAVTHVHTRAEAAGGPVALRDLLRRARLPRLAKALSRAG